MSNNLYFNKWSGSPKERLNLFYSAWDSDSKFIIASKGGSGISHFFPSIELSKINNKKIFCGYSDLTLILLHIYNKFQMISFHGPNGLKELDEKSLNSLKNALKMKNYEINFNSSQILYKSKNIVSGKLIGGNLSRLLEYLIHEKINFKKSIVFLEDVNETDFKIFNKLSHLKNYKGFKPNAIIFGNLGIEFNNKMKNMVSEIFKDIPIIYNLPFGHQLPNITLPIGGNSKIDFSKKNILISFPKKYKKYSVNL